jgi:hypothetical protein
MSVRRIAKIGCFHSFEWFHPIIRMIRRFHSNEPFSAHFFGGFSFVVGAAIYKGGSDNKQTSFRADFACRPIRHAYFQIRQPYCAITLGYWKIESPNKQKSGNCFEVPDIFLIEVSEVNGL